MLDVLVRLAENTSDAGRTEPRVRRSLVAESLTVVEQLGRMIDERCRAGGEGNGRSKVETIADMQEDVSAGSPRLESSDRGFQSIASLRGLAREHGIGPLAEWLDSACNSESLERMISDRHAIVHTVGFLKFDAARACAVTRSFARAALAGWPRDLIACMLIEGNVLDSAGMPGGACPAYEAAPDACRAAAASGVGGAWLRTCEGHAPARLGRAGEAEASYGAA